MGNGTVVYWKKYYFRMSWLTYIQSCMCCNKAALAYCDHHIHAQTRLHSLQIPSVLTTTYQPCRMSGDKCSSLLQRYMSLGRYCSSSSLPERHSLGLLKRAKALLLCPHRRVLLMKRMRLRVQMRKSHYCRMLEGTATLSVDTMRVPEAVVSDYILVCVLVYICSISFN